MLDLTIIIYLSVDQIDDARSRDCVIVFVRAKCGDGGGGEQIWPWRARSLLLAAAAAAVAAARCAVLCCVLAANWRRGQLSIE